MKKTPRTKPSPTVKNGATVGVKKAALELMKDLPADCSWDDDDGLSPEWQAGIERRIQEIESGQVEGIDHEEMMQAIREQRTHGRTLRAGGTGRSASGS